MMSKIFLSEKQITKLLKISEDHPRDHAMFHVALATGFRIGDILRLKRDDITHNCTDTIRIKMRKTGKMVERPVPATCRDAINKYLSTRTDDNPYLFTSTANRTSGNKPMNESTAYRVFKSYLKLVCPPGTDLRGNACHTTRRSMAQIIRTKAGQVEPATRFLGHSSIGATIAYLDMDSFNRQADEIVQTLPWNKQIDRAGELL